MKFIVNIEKEKFNKYIEESSVGSFMQKQEWGVFKANYGWKYNTFSVVDDNENIIAAAMIMFKTLPVLKSKKMGYAPRGFVLDYENKKLFNFFISNLKKYCKDENIILVKFDPIVRLNERDNKGILKEGSFDNTNIVNNIIKEGIYHTGYNLGFENMQPRFTMVTDITKSEEEILKSFHSKYRYNVKLAYKKGVKIVEGKEEDLKVFHDIMKVTGDRDEFLIRPLSYFENMVKHCEGAKLYLAKYNIKNAINLVTKDIEKEKIALEKVSEDKKKYNTSLNRIKKLESELQTLKEETENEVILSGAVFFEAAKKGVYLYGASSNKFRNVMANNLIQWEMIKHAKKNGCKTYDFRGISGNLDKSDHLYGLYKFKKGFGSEVVEYIGEFDLVVDKFLYKLWKFALPKIRIIRKIKGKILR